MYDMAEPRERTPRENKRARWARLQNNDFMYSIYREWVDGAKPTELAIKHDLPYKYLRMWRNGFEVASSLARPLFDALKEHSDSFTPAEQDKLALLSLNLYPDRK